MFGQRRASNEKIVEALYEAIVAAARQEPFYAQAQVPDIPLGRYEMLSLHMLLFLRRMKRETDPAAQELTQAVVEEFFKDIDHSLRELGIGDSSVPKRMKKLARMFYGRGESYGAALEDNDIEGMTRALKRNIRPDDEKWPQAPALTQYAFAAVRNLDEQSAAQIVRGRLVFPDAAGAMQVVAD
ncbi:ubiquinol-cytochrome c chaperone [Limoniibacter endophyticus]|uniref:Ubiquinol-cytochrome c chaperone n=1 Tax=Limoniibacter endophyticus TaxID=1565040 RepID=A0A8J3GJQ8_9HYPH|nr:ubiquinol-cytochrome c chaperone [Limoniibacter endophyticus]